MTKEEKRVYMVEWRKRHPRYHRSYYKPEVGRAEWLMYSYKITLADYHSLFSEQKGCCAICGKHQSELKRNLAVDHDHLTGQVRGLLCTKCNVSLGNFKDDLQHLQNAVTYLQRGKK